MSYYPLPMALALTAALAVHGQPFQSTTEHVDQFELLDLVKAGRNLEAFLEAEEAGDEHFATRFVKSDGVGARIQVGSPVIFARTPRADLKGPGEWFNHFPARVSGPNGQSCAECHNVPVEDGGGAVVANIQRDPFREARIDHFLDRNPPLTMGLAGPQLLAEEMTTTLHNIREGAVRTACGSPVGTTVTRTLSAKGVGFGTISVRRNSAPAGTCSVTLNVGGVRGVDADLVIKPFQWKGNTRFVREFNRGASNTELGMQPVELLRTLAEDGDFDGIVNEFTVGDQTALAVYNAAQPRPVTRLELDDLGLDTPEFGIEPVTAAERAAVGRGSSRFSSIGCTSCHMRSLTVNNRIFAEPSRHKDFRDGATFPAGISTLATGLDPAFPITFDITRDQPGNVIRNEDGSIRARLGSFRRNSSGGAIIELFSDLKRHDLGPLVAEPVDETASPNPTVPGTFQGGVGATVFLTRAIWGVGATPPYMQDGSSPDLTDAIERHGGEASTARANFRALSAASKADLLAFLNNLTLFKLEEEEEK